LVIFLKINVTCFFNVNFESKWQYF
jgi:hypothetical protein